MNETMKIRPMSGTTGETDWAAETREQLIALAEERDKARASAEFWMGQWDREHGIRRQLEARASAARERARAEAIRRDRRRGRIVAAAAWGLAFGFVAALAWGLWFR